MIIAEVEKLLWEGRQHLRGSTPNSIVNIGSIQGRDGLRYGVLSRNSFNSGSNMSGEIMIVIQMLTISLERANGYSMICIQIMDHDFKGKKWQN